MSKRTTGGTFMWCSHCQKVTTCKALSPKEVFSTLKSGRRFYQTNHNDVHFFRRGRRCLTCQRAFLTAETRESFLDELVQLRDALAVIKRDAEAYIKDSEKTSHRLTSLTTSLGKLQALNIYQRQKPAA